MDLDWGEPCRECDGTGVIDCGLCLGTGIGQHGDPDTSKCGRCGGKGWDDYCGCEAGRERRNKRRAQAWGRRNHG